MPKLPKIITKTLSLRLSLIMVSAIAILLVSSLFVMFYFSQRALRKELIADANETLNGKAKQIDNILLGIEQSVGNVYWNLIEHLDQPVRLEADCRELVNCNPNIYGCAIAFKPGYFADRELFMTYVHRIDYHASATRELVTQHSFTSRPYTQQIWYTTPMTTGRAGWTESLKNEDTEGEPIITFALPLYGNNMQLLGVVAVDLSINHLSEVLLADKPLSEGYIALLDNKGSYIIHQDIDKLSYQTVFTQTDKNSSIDETAKAMLNGESGFRAFVMNDKKYHVLFKPFVREAMPERTTDDLGWSLGVIYPDYVIFHEYNQLLINLIVIIIVGLLLFFWLCRKIVFYELKPLKLVTHAAQRIADGNYSETIPDTHQEDEIGQLQAHFLKMQQALKTRMDEQEQLSAQLQERAHILQTAYSQAQKADQMKTAFLHFMTNQMIKPADVIEYSVNDLCDNSHSAKEMERLTAIICQQGDALIKVLDHLIKEADNHSEEPDNEYAL